MLQTLLCCGGSPGSSCGAHEPEEGSANLTGGSYSAEELEELPGTVTAASLGCGSPTALATLSPGAVVLDLRSGGGIDVLLSARWVSLGGRAYGLDMTDEMLEASPEQLEKGGRRERRVSEGANKGCLAPRRSRRRSHKQLCHKPLDGQACGDRGGLQGAKARRSVRGLRRSVPGE